MSSVTNKTKAYPSGHACQSMLVGLYVASKFPEHERGVIAAAKEGGLGRVKAGFHYLADYVAGNLLAEKMFMVMNKDNYGKYINEAKRIPRKKGQPAGSDKHSDLYTDENPRGTIHGLGFKDVKTAEASVKKIEGSGKTHAHKIQAAIAMEQRARVMGKKAEAAVYRKYIEKMKKKTKQMQKEDVRKMPGGGYGVYADVFKKGKRVMTPGGKHRKELKKVYKNEKDANDYMAAIMIAKGGG